MAGVRVLQLLGRSAGGIATHVAQISSALNADPVLTVDVAGPPGSPVRIERLVHDVVVPDGPLIGHRQAIRRVGRILETGNYEVIHAHGLRAGIDASIAARRTRARVLLTVHNLVRRDISGKLKAPLYRRAESLAVNGADKVFAVSRDIASHLIREASGSAGKVEVLYLGIGKTPVPRASKLEMRSALGIGREPLICTASRLSPQKALPVMLEAVQRLPEVRLVILGEGPDEARLRRLAADLGIEDRVHFLGFRPDVHDVIAASDVFCLSSVWEGVPLAAQEAILLKVPVVATSVGGMPELIQDGVSGRLVGKGDAEALARALREVASDPESARRYATVALEHLTDRFSTEKMLARLRAEYLGSSHGVLA
jgi:glycosyltransferase involved in cell wall biosynthesis